MFLVYPIGKHYLLLKAKHYCRYVDAESELLAI